MNEVHNKNVFLEAAAGTNEVARHILRLEEPI